MLHICIYKPSLPKPLVLYIKYLHIFHKHWMFLVFHDSFAEGYVASRGFAVPFTPELATKSCDRGDPLELWQRSKVAIRQFSRPAREGNLGELQLQDELCGKPMEIS